MPVVRRDLRQDSPASEEEQARAALAWPGHRARPGVQWRVRLAAAAVVFAWLIGFGLYFGLR